MTELNVLKWDGHQSLLYSYKTSSCTSSYPDSPSDAHTFYRCVSRHIILQRLYNLGLYKCIELNTMAFLTKKVNAAISLQKDTSCLRPLGQKINNMSKYFGVVVAETKLSLQGYLHLINYFTCDAISICGGTII